MISDDDDSFISDTESERGFGGANVDDNGSEGAIPNVGAQGPNFAIDGKGWRRSTQRRDPIQRLVPGAYVNDLKLWNFLGLPNISTHKGYPKTVWKSDTNGSLERFNLWTF